jgi:fibronectin type 3 domain-containing protein
VEGLAAATNTYTDTKIGVGKTATYAVKAFVGTAYSSYKTVTGTRLTGVGIPQATATTNLTTGVTLTWAAIPDATSYGVYRQDSTNGPWTILVEGLTEITYTDTSITPGKTATYAVKAFIEKAYSSYKTVTGTRTIGIPVVTPQNLTTGVKLTWTAITGATSYGIYRQDTINGPWTTVVDGLAATTYTDTTITSGATATYAVKAFVGTAYSSYITVTGTRLTG